MLSMGTALTIWLDYNHAMIRQEAENLLKKWYTRAVLLAIALTFGITIGFSRIILGVHTWNQLLLGW